MELARYGYTGKCIGCRHARLGLKPADHGEECRARIVRHMTADDDLSGWEVASAGAAFPSWTHSWNTQKPAATPKPRGGTTRAFTPWSAA